MARGVKIWFDREGDFLEVRFEEGRGFMRATSHDSVMERVDEQGRLLGFSVLGVSRVAADHPLLAQLSTGPAA